MMQWHGNVYGHHSLPSLSCIFWQAVDLAADAQTACLFLLWAPHNCSACVQCYGALTALSSVWIAVQVRFRTLALNQTLLLALAMLRSLPVVCSTPNAKEPFSACMGQGIMLILLLGFALPLAVLRAFEIYARRIFLSSPAAREVDMKQT